MLPVDGEMAEKIKLVPYPPKRPPPGWKCPKKFKLGLGSPGNLATAKMIAKKLMSCFV